MSTARIPKTSSSVHDIHQDKPPFGSRFLTGDADVWSQNAWDHVPPPVDQSEAIAASLERQRKAPVPEDEKARYNDKPAKHWDNFYKMNADNFFRNRKWLHLEFPELVAASKPEAGPLTIAEIGCGAGNAVFPLLSANENPLLNLRAYDYSSHAVKLVQHNPLYLSPPVGTISAAVWDLSSDTLPADLLPESVDIVILVFVLSALHPNEWRSALSNIHKVLKPGGRVFVRDYGRHDLTQLRFKGGRLLDDNFYVRGDKTRVYFFELDELALLFTGSVAAPAQKTIYTTEEQEDACEGDASASPVPHTTSPNIIEPTMLSVDETLSASASTTAGSRMEQSLHPSLMLPAAPADSPPHPLFAIDQLGIDRRLLVNRKRQLKMYRVWMQGKFRKI